MPQICIHTLFLLGAGLQICIHTLFVLSVNRVSVNRRGPTILENSSNYFSAEEVSGVWEPAAKFGFCAFNLFDGLLSRFELSVDPLLLFCPVFDPIADEDIDTLLLKYVASRPSTLWIVPTYLCTSSLVEHFFILGDCALEVIRKQTLFRQ